MHLHPPQKEWEELQQPQPEHEIQEEPITNLAGGISFFMSPHLAAKQRGKKKLKREKTTSDKKKTIEIEDRKPIGHDQ